MSSIQSTGEVGKDWTQDNAIDYNPELDQILLSSNHFSEIWIIDHGTTPMEAMARSGGRYGKGGDFIYGVTVTQSNSMLRYVGKVAALYPEDNLQALYCDEAMDAVEDLRLPTSSRPTRLRLMKRTLTALWTKPWSTRVLTSTDGA